MRASLRLLAAALATFALVLPSRCVWNAGAGAAAELRLSWRLAAPTVQACRPPRPDEVAGLPQHMRPTQVCEGGPVSFSLTVVLDGSELAAGLVPGNDSRVLSVFERFPVSPGRHQLVVDFLPDSGVPRLPEGLARRFRGPVDFVPGRAVLLTLQDGDLVLRN